MPLNSLERSTLRVIILVALASLVSCGSNSTPSGSPSTPATATGQQTGAQPALTFQVAGNLYNTKIPVPVGWTMLSAQDLALLSPPGGGAPEFKLLLEGVPPADAYSGNCDGGTLPTRIGPTLFAGHEGSYEEYCPGDWSVRLPSSDGLATWIWDYFGATGIESGPDAELFKTVLQAFAAPNVPRKPTQSPAPAS